jgi:hypothetical protein
VTRNLLLGAFSALVMLPLAELFLRWTVPDVEIRTPLTRGGFLRPYVPHAEADLVSADFRVRYAIDDWGFRDESQREGGSRRCLDWNCVLLLGDSFTEGYGVQERESYARRLGSDGRFAVWNLSRMGASPLFYVVMAREFVPRLHPRFVVVQLFDNDLDENRFRRIPREADGRVGAFPDSLRPRADALGRLGDTWRGFALVQAFDRLERRLEGKQVPRIFVRVNSRVDVPVPPDTADRLFPWYDPARVPEWEPKLAEQEVLVRQLVAELREMQVRYVLIAYVPHGAELVGGDPEASRARNPHARMLARVTRELGVAFIDGIDVFAAPGRRPSDYYYEHDQHWNSAGHALFAAALRSQADELVAGEFW